MLEEFASFDALEKVEFPDPKSEETNTPLTKKDA